MHTPTVYADIMSQDDKPFFEALGTRIATLRKHQSLTQAQLGELLGVSQQQVASFEAARRRVPASLLPTLAKALAVSVEDLLGLTPKPTKRGPAPQLQQKLERLSQLPKSRQRFVLDFLDTVLEKNAR